MRMHNILTTQSYSPHIPILTHGCVDLMFVGGQGDNRQAQGWCWIVEDPQAIGKLLVRACACVCVRVCVCACVCVVWVSWIRRVFILARVWHAFEIHCGALQHFFHFFSSLLTFLAFLRAPAMTSVCLRHFAWKQVIFSFNSLQLTATTHGNTLQHTHTHGPVALCLTAGNKRI